MKLLRTKLFNSTFHHYTTLDAIPGILEEGLRTDRRKELGRPPIYLSAFEASNDELAKDLNNWSKINDEISRRSERLHRLAEKPEFWKKNYPATSGVDSWFFAEDERYPLKYRQMNLLDGEGGNSNGSKKVPIVRVVGESSKDNLRLQPRTPMEFDLFDDFIKNPVPKKGTRLESLAKVGEVSVHPNDVIKDSLRVQFPFGSVTKNNSEEYKKLLKNIPSSKIDLADTYTRRIYKLLMNKR